MANETAVKPPQRWQMKALAGASLLATFGIVWMALGASRELPPWVGAGVGSPLAVKCLILIAAGVVVLLAVVLALANRRTSRRGRFGAFNGDQGGSAAIEMTLLFPFALMIFLIVIQATILFNANMVVNYAAFAATRTATTVVPMEILFNDPMRDENHNRVVPPGEGDSKKLEMIRRAAVLALIPVSASLTNGGDGETGALVHDQTVAVFHRLGAPDQGWFRRIKPQYDYADTYTQTELSKPSHWRDGDPDHPFCPYNAGLTHNTGVWNDAAGTYVYAPWCYSFHRLPNMRWDFEYWEDLEVRLTYQFLLEVPYASKFLGEEVQIPGLSGKQYATQIRVTSKLSNEGGPELRTRD
jgi:hypothetical protein